MPAKVIAIVVASVIWVVGVFQNVPQDGAPNASSSPSPTQYPSPTPILTPKPPSSPPPVFSPLPSPTSTNSAAGWEYPQASFKGGNSWMSSDLPSKITDWYESKIETAGMNAKSFVQTNTNGNVLNKLVAADGKSTIEIEISRSGSDAQTTITIKN